MCIENAFYLKIIDLMLRSLEKNFTRRKFFYLFVSGIGKVQYELLPQGEIINSAKYCNQLDKLKAAIREKQPKLVYRRSVIFHLDNVKPYITLTIRQKLTYSLIGMFYSIFHIPQIFIRLLLVLTLKNFLFYDKQFQSISEIKIHLDDFASKKKENNEVF